jgi:hypothetical protein
VPDGTAKLKPCDNPPKNSTELTDYDQFAKGKRFWVAMRHEGKVGWQPVAHIDMPLHHASRLDWQGLDGFGDLEAHRHRGLRFTFSAIGSDIQKVPQRQQWRAKYKARVEAICGSKM